MATWEFNILHAIVLKAKGEYITNILKVEIATYNSFLKSTRDAHVGGLHDYDHNEPLNPF